ncbi:glycoside hydrolase family 71 protein [Serpula lacrymans var. lacrymans S7.3]|uniref:Glycoside hydrolase family 71 protein n=2 Tax=Serpula lacrymans var. lacrymans TaxID=341189 RepID=F8QD29_SERL3|nr:glycoside hydrolase family 71 protein [Serpula lacrymans var. lacrymans S7.9]EGN94044.1 glycoside hydrolase family 71 protein [Serpula lacrymans var. lacrymans S7.3]EGO19393.1 glycoside hydrolase family 71 protein [Serpula lacrymans var. lacrymans S7.9]
MIALTAAILTSLALARASSAQNVFAHFMAQNSYSYTPSDWTNDMKTAQSIGIDGFALNIAANDYEVGQIVTAFAAAEALNFKLFYSFDMSYSWQQSDMVDIVANQSSSSSNFLWNGNLLVSSYEGESYGDSFWSGFKSALASKGINITLAPAFTSYRDPTQASTMASTFPSIDGFFNWWSWPADVDANLTTATDLAYQSAISSRSGPYIMAVSPWQFKNIDGAGDWVEYSDTLWDYRWQQAVNDVKPDIVEIVTWNDYGESHYIGDINPVVDLGTQAPFYVDGFDHSKWRDVANYYIQYFKNGSAPTITTDEVVFWYRAYPKGINCSSGSLPRNADFPEDAVFALAMLTQAATVTLSIGSNTVNYSAPAGISMGSVPFPTEDQQIPYIEISRNGNKVVDGYGSMYVNQTGCTYYNFNPWVGSISA